MHCHRCDSVCRVITAAAVKINKMADCVFPHWEGKTGWVFANFLERWLHYKVYNHHITKTKETYHAHNVNRWKGSVEPRPFIGLLILDVINRVYFWSCGSYLLCLYNNKDERFSCLYWIFQDFPVGIFSQQMGKEILFSIWNGALFRNQIEQKRNTVSHDKLSMSPNWQILIHTFFKKILTL